MNCHEINDRLSDYYDGQLSTDPRQAFDRHLASCADCRQKLSEFRRLSECLLAASTPKPPLAIWDRVVTALTSADPVAGHERPSTRRGWARGRRTWLGRHRWVLALAGLVALTMTVALGYPRWKHWQAERQVAADFNRYLQLFPSNPTAAQRILASKYTVTGYDWQLTAGRASGEYRPAYQLANHFRVESAMMWRMPCCDCLQVICRRADGSRVAVFRHDQAEPDWLSGCPTVATECAGKACRIVRASSDLAATWSVGSHHYTIIGARDTDEVKQLIGVLDGRSGGGQSSSVDVEHHHGVYS